MDECSRQRQFEDQFLTQLRTQAGKAVRGPLRADSVLTEAMPDGMDTIRAALERLEIYDRNVLEKLPGKRAMQLTFRRAVLGGLLQSTVSRLRAQVLTAVDALANERDPGPVDRDQVLNALARYELLPRNQRPSAVVFASPTGFTDAARSLVESTGAPTLILMGGRDDGGWDVVLPESVRKSPWAKVFELESQDELLKRFMHHLEQSPAELDSSGISIDALAAKLGIDKKQTEALMRRACRADSRLMTVVDHDKIHICRTPLGEEGDTMSLWSKIRRMLGMKPTVAERVRELTAQRVLIEQQRHEVDRKIDVLETEEREALKNGAQAASNAEKKQIAGRLMRTRRDLRRLHAQAVGFTQQIDIIGTQIHNMTLAEQGRRVSLPSAEELTAEAAKAEEVMSELAANAEMAASIEVGARSMAGDDEEAAILAEFAEVADARQEKAARPETESPEEAAGQRETVARPERATPSASQKGREAGREMS